MSQAVKDFLSKEARNNIALAIRDAEKNTTGEIRVRVDAHSKNDQILDAATAIFYQLGMEKTQHQNGVLVYIAVEDKKYCIIGDKAIDHIVHQIFWDNIAAQLHDFFVNKEFEKGIIHIIQEIGTILYQHFPIQHLSNENELPDEISFG